MATKQTNSRTYNYKTNTRLVMKMQPIAIKVVYNVLWADSNIIEIDADTKNKLAVIIDTKGGADKLLRFNSGYIAFLAQRFRSFGHLYKDDWTLRKTEYDKAIDALQNNGFISSFYAYGYVNKEETEFLKFIVLRYKEALEYLQDSRYSPHWIPNRDGKTSFTLIPFDLLPKDLFLYDERPYRQSNLFRDM